MKIKTVSVSAGESISMDYNSCRADISMTAELEEGENVDDVKDQLSELITDYIEEESGTRLKNLIDRVNEVKNKV